MNCACACDADYDPSDAYWEYYRKARVAHVCCECGETIKPGEMYEYCSQVSDGEWFVNKTCDGCLSLRNAYCRSYIFGELREVLWDCLGFDYVTGESQCWECSATIPRDTDICPECGWVEPGSEEERKRS